MSALHRGGTTINHCFEEAFVISVVTYREMVDHQSPNDRMHVFYQDMDPHLRNFHTGWTGPDEMAEDLDGIIGTMFIMFRYQMDHHRRSCFRGCTCMSRVRCKSPKRRGSKPSRD